MIDKNIDEKFIKECIDLSQKSYENSDLPFGAVIVYDEKIIAEGLNTGLTDITGHAEINAIKKVLKKYPDIDWTKCTLYSNFEPCAMCSFVIRDIGIGRIVFSSPSPHLGGFSKWDILTNKNLNSEFTTKQNSTPPKITKGILRKEAEKIFNKLQWKMHKK